jgi:phosphate transport system permease protein
MSTPPSGLTPPGLWMEEYLQPAPGKGGRNHGRRSSPLSWRWSDRIVLVLAWLVGILLCLIAGSIVVYMGVRGIQYLSPSVIFSHPNIADSGATSGGFLDPILGTLILTVIGIAIALPLGLACATWLVEYGRPAWLARVVESSIEIIAGTPDIVLAIFGLALFQVRLLAPFSVTAEGGGVFGRSFIAAGTMISLLALPAIYTASRDGLQAAPSHMREAAFALGKTRITTIRRVLLPHVRSNIATGTVLGISRIIGSTAIVLILLGGFGRIEPEGAVPVVGLLRGTGSALTSYVYYNSPAGEGAAPQKAYAAAFVLLIFVLALNLLVERMGRKQAGATGLTTTAGVV